ncbi:MAG: tRNA (adenosine(37)-N6)-threonylcarbamoyltransferase complex transferase subunit TsaD [Eubacteriaceae bacterium]
MSDKDIVILGIETSCDETSAALVINGRKLRSNIIYSQIKIHQPFGGVVPEVASRNHVKKIDMIVKKALDESNINLNEIDGVAVTYGPGLVGSLLVGLSYAKAISYCIKKPLIGINHIEGHICANYINNYDIKPPFLSLVASGGHTNLILVKDYGVYEVLGQTRDDAAGEAFDKISRSLGFGYPGGPAIDKASKLGDPGFVNFPRAFLEDESYDFSFSGLKSSVLNYLNSCKMKGIEIEKENVAASFQKAVVEVLAIKAVNAAVKYDMKTICISGGVARNSSLRETLSILTKEKEILLHFPEPDLCSDNAAMIASAGYYKYENNEFSNYDLNAVSNLKII